MTSIRFRLQRDDEHAELSVVEVQGMIVIRRFKAGEAGEVTFEHCGWEEMGGMPNELMAELKAEGFELVDEADHLNDELDADYYRVRYGVEPPARLMKFVDEELTKYEGKCAHGLPMWADNVLFRMHFRYGFLPFLSMLYDDDDLSRGKQYVPLALLSIHGETSEFIAVDVTAPECPVSMWYHGSGTYYPVWDSLDEFLESLEDSDDKAFAER